MKLRNITLALLGAAAATASAQGAQAQDAADFAAKLSAAYGSAGYEIALGEATTQGDAITFDGATISVSGDSGTEPLEVTMPLTFSGVTETADGGYLAESLTVPDIDTEVDGAEVVVQNIEIGNIYVPGSGSIGMLQMLQLFGSLSIGPISVTVDGTEVFTLDTLTASTTFDPEQGSAELASLTSTADATGLSLDLSLAKGEEDFAAIEALGLTSITGEVHQDVTWSMDDGRMNVTEMLIALDELGSLDATLDIAGYTPELMDQMAAQQATLAAIEDPEERSAAEIAAGMAMLSQLTLSGFGLRYEDASLAGKLLDFFAEAQSVSREELVAQLKVIAPAMLAAYGNQQLLTEVTEAVSAFLDNPESLEIRIAPASPLSFAALSAAAADPASLLEEINLSITANSPAGQ